MVEIVDLARTNGDFPVRCVNVSMVTVMAIVGDLWMLGDY